MRFVQAFDFLVAIACESDLNFIFGVLRERVCNQRTAARAQGQSFDVLFLRDVCANPDCLSTDRTRRAHREAADLLRG